MLKIPTTKEIYDAMIADVQSELGGTIPLWRKAFVRALCMAMAPSIKLAYLYAGSVQKNMFPDLADSEAVGGTLERFGRAKLGRGPLPSTQGSYIITVMGDIGTIIPVNTTFKSDVTASNPDVMYVVDNTVTLANTTEEIEVRCLTAGLEGRQAVGDVLIVTAPIVGLQNKAIVSQEYISPTSGETIEEYRKVVLQSYRLMPQGGAPADFRLWAQDAFGVYETYPYSKNAAPGSVIVFVEATKEDSTDGKGTPPPSVLLEVESVILVDPNTGRGRLPLGVVALDVQPITVVEVDIEISSFVGLTTLKQQTINAAIDELINSVRPFVAGADTVSNKNDILSVNTIVAKILEVLPGSAFAAPKLTVTVPGNVATDVTSFTFDYGAIPYLNSISYV